MHERIETARHTMACDLCGLLIQPGEKFRSVKDEYSTVIYHEHIRCPCNPAVAADISPKSPKHPCHAVCMA